MIQRTTETSFQRKQNGFVAMDVLVSVGIASILVLSISTAIYQTYRSLDRKKLISTRDLVILSVRKNAININSLRASLNTNENKPYYDCVCGSATACQNMNKSSLTLYDSPNVKSQSFFNRQGFACDQNSPDCVISVNYTVASQCPPAAPFPSNRPIPSLTCSAPAEFIIIEYEVLKNPLTVDPQYDFTPVRSKAYVPTSEINPAGSGVCP